MKNAWILGLTGGIGSGKSTVGNFLAEFGCGLVDADVCAREAVAPGTEGLAGLTGRFGPGILRGDGTLDRARLRTVVFTDPDSLDFVNALLHPLIGRIIAERLARPEGAYTVLMAPLLFEKGLDRLTDRVLCMDIGEEVQIARTMERDGCSREIAAAIIRRQWPAERRRARSDDVLVSDFPTLAELKEAVRALHRKYLALSGGGGQAR